jgi:hypothetical protein
MERSAASSTVMGDPWRGARRTDCGRMMSYAAGTTWRKTEFRLKWNEKKGRVPVNKSGSPAAVGRRPVQMAATTCA